MEKKTDTQPKLKASKSMSPVFKHLCWIVPLPALRRRLQPTNDIVIDIVLITYFLSE